MNNEKFEQLKLNFLPRFWDTVNKVMIYPELDNSKNFIVYKYNYENKQIYLTIEYLIYSDSCTMMKPIGLKDNNNNLIYDGDIILSNIEYGGEKFVIVGGVRSYYYDAVVLEYYNKGLREASSGGKGASAHHIINNHGECRIVGNIHSNPEMLKE